jgi:hypothetical protein
MSKEQIKLEAGQWYRVRTGGIVYVASVSEKHDAYLLESATTPYYCKASGKHFFGTDGWDIIEHLPDCTGFDWVPPPKLQLREGAWYERKDGKIVGPCEPYKNPSWAPEANWEVAGRWYSDDGKNPAPETNLIREVEPPQPKYRPFANLKEFYPHHNRLVCVNVPNPRVLELYKVQVFNDHTFWLHTETGKSYASGLLDYQFADYVDGKLVFSPFGVQES